MKKVITANDNVAKAIGPYSHAVRFGNLLYTSGQMGTDRNGVFVSDTVAGQTVQCLKNVEAVLSAAGFTMADVLKTTVYLTDMNAFSEMNEKYVEFFYGGYPARCCVQVSRLPKDALVEIEVVAGKED